MTPAVRPQPLSLDWTWAWPTQWDAAYAAHVVALAPLFIAFAVAAVVDWRVRKIPNWLTFTLVAAGLVRSVATWLAGTDFTPLDAVLGFLAGAAVGVPLFILGARGAGDAKLYMAAGAWVGWQGVVVLAVLEAVVGLVVVVATAAAKGRLRMLLANTGALVVTFLHLRRVGMDQARENAQRFTIYGPVREGERVRFASVARPLPHAVPFLAAAVLAVMLGRI